MVTEASQSNIFFELSFSVFIKGNFGIGLCTPNFFMKKMNGETEIIEKINMKKISKKDLHKVFFSVLYHYL